MKPEKCSNRSIPNEDPEKLTRFPESRPYLENILGVKFFFIRNTSARSNFKKKVLLKISMR